MPGARKHTVVIASVLKPVDDTRGYEKLGCSLAASGLFEVHVIGSEGSQAVAAENIHFHSLGTFQRLTLKRWQASFKVLAIIRKLRPDVLIICTHELAAIATYVKIFMHTKIVYDVQENYFRNIIHTDAFPALLRWPFALGVRSREVVSAQFFDLFILAERTYEEQLGFARGKSVIIENKAIVPRDFQRNPSQGIELLFSGTLSESTGVFDAIRIASLLHQEDSSVRLHIIGYCASSTDRARIRKEATGKEYIQLTGIDVLQPHSLIIQAISTASFGVVCYPHSPHTEGAVPTKVYEYLSCGLPVLATTQWAELFEPYNAAVVFGSGSSTKEIIDNLCNGKFYTRKPEGTLWKDEEAKLVRSVSQLLK